MECPFKEEISELLSFYSIVSRVNKHVIETKRKYDCCFQSLQFEEKLRADLISCITTFIFVRIINT